MSVSSVLFVCAGNIVRSPLAAALLRRQIDQRPRLAGIAVGSAGTMASDSSPALPEVVFLGREAGLQDLGRHVSQPFTPALGRSVDLVLTVSPTTTADARRIAPEARIEMLGTVVGTGTIVKSPSGLSLAPYRRCFRQLEGLVRRLADRLEAEAGR